MWFGPAAGLVQRIGQIGIIDITHCRFTISAIMIPPKQHTCICQCKFFSIVSKMFQDDICSGNIRLNAIIILFPNGDSAGIVSAPGPYIIGIVFLSKPCLLYTSDAADDLLCVDLGGRRIIKKKNKTNNSTQIHYNTEHISPTSTP